MNEIIVGIDGSRGSSLAADRAAELAHNYQRPLHVVMAVLPPTIPDFSTSSAMMFHPETASPAALIEQARLLVDTVADKHRGVVPVTTTFVASGDPASVICAEAARLQASLIVVGNKRMQGVSRILGSVAGHVSRISPCDVMIVNTT